MFIKYYLVDLYMNIVARADAAVCDKLLDIRRSRESEMELKEIMGEVVRISEERLLWPRNVCCPYYQWMELSFGICNALGSRAFRCIGDKQIPSAVPLYSSYTDWFKCTDSECDNSEIAGEHDPFIVAHV